MIKKLTRIQKRQNLKRKKKTTEPADIDVEDDDENDLPIEKKVDKALIKQQIANRDYDMTLHFSKKSTLEVE